MSTEDVEARLRRLANVLHHEGWPARYEAARDAAAALRADRALIAVLRAERDEARAEAQAWVDGFNRGEKCET